MCFFEGTILPVIYWYKHNITYIHNQSPQKSIMSLRFLLPLLPRFSRMFICIDLSMYLWYCDCSHTIQRRALKLRHNIPRVNNSRHFFSNISKIVFSRVTALCLYISLKFLCNFEEQLRKNKWR